MPGERGRGLRVYPEPPVLVIMRYTMPVVKRVTGAKSVAYQDKMMCCGFGGGMRARHIEIALDTTREKLTNMISAGVDCIVNPCASCHLEFDRGQVQR